MSISWKTKKLKYMKFIAVCESWLTPGLGEESHENIIETSGKSEYLVSVL